MAGERMRIFIGVEVCDAALKTALMSWQKYAEPLLGERWRLTKPYNFHLTLRFLGQTEEVQVKQIIENLPGWVADSKVLALKAKGIKLLPSSKKIRVVALEFENSPILGRMVERIDSGLSDLGFDASALEFLPHITLARHKGKALNSLDITGLDWSQDDSVFLSVKSVIVFSSESSPTGVVYRPLSKVLLL